MGASTRIVQLVLLSLSALAAYSFYTVLVPQGLQGDLTVFAEQKLLPGTTIPVKDIKYTGIGPLDDYIHSLNYFFWPILHDNDYVRKARSQMFIGQFMTGWTLIMLESERPGNQGRFVSYIIFWGLATQAVGYGLAMPLWMAITIGASFLANPRPQQVVPDSRACRAIPLSVILGFLVPGILGYLPAPQIWTYEQKLLAMGAWQVFPVWTAISQQIFKRVLSDYAIDSQSSRAGSWRLSSALKTPYIFVLTVAGLIRVGSIARIIYDIQYVPTKGGPTWDVFQQLLFPKLLDPSMRHNSLAAGSATFLEWDETAGQTALVLYSAVQCFMVWRPKKSSDYTFLALGLPLTWLLTGSSGVAVAYLATRDSAVIRRGGKSKKLK